MAKNQDTLIEQSFIIIEQLSLPSVIQLQQVRNVAADFDSRGMARAGGHDLF